MFEIASCQLQTHSRGEAPERDECRKNSGSADCRRADLFSEREAGQRQVKKGYSYMSRSNNTGVRTRKRIIGYYDYNLLACLILLLSFGLIVLYSASAYEAYASANISDNMYFFRHQLRNSAIALIWAVLLSKISYHFMARFAGALYAAGFVLMALVQSPLGVEELGARRWLRIGPIQFQPSEVAKIGVIVFLPMVLLKMGKKYKSWKGQLLILSMGALQAVGAWKLTENLSTGIIIFLITVVIWLVSYPDIKKYLIFGGGIAVAGVGILLYLKDHLNLLESEDGGFRIQRIYEWLSGGSYQIHQGLYAIGSGGFFGKGLGNSTQKLGTIPEAQNDMIFSIVCEELGVFGAILLLLMFGYLLYRLFMIAQNAPDLYGTLVVTGVFAHIAIQVILNLLVVLNMMPATGITLPFISYGGTSMMFLMTELGIALSVANSIRFKETVVVQEHEKNVLTNV